MGILDDENKLIDDLSKSVTEEIYCRHLGKVYMTKQGVLGYVWNIHPDGTPKTLVYVNSNEIGAQELYEIEHTLQSFYKETGWYIPTWKQFMDSIYSWYNTGLDSLKIVSFLLGRAYDDFYRINFLYHQKHQPTPISHLRGVYWLKYGNETYDMTREIYIEDIERSLCLQIQHKNNVIAPSREILFLKDLEENEIQSYEESDKMIENIIKELSPGRF